MTIKIDDTLELKQVQTNEYEALYALVDNNRPQLRENGCPGWTTCQHQGSTFQL